MGIRLHMISETIHIRCQSLLTITTVGAKIQSYGYEIGVNLTKSNNINPRNREIPLIIAIKYKIIGRRYAINADKGVTRDYSEI